MTIPDGYRILEEGEIIPQKALYKLTLRDKEWEDFSFWAGVKYDCKSQWSEGLVILAPIIGVTTLQEKLDAALLKISELEKECADLKSGGYVS